MLKEEGNTSHACKRYDQDSANKYKVRFRDDTSVLRSSIPATTYVLNSWCLVNVGLQAVKKIPKEYWISSFNKSNLQPNHCVSFIQWCDRIRPFLQVIYSFKRDKKITIDDEYYLLPYFGKIMDPAEKKAVVEAFESYGICNVPLHLRVSE